MSQGKYIPRPKHDYPAARDADHHAAPVVFTSRSTSDKPAVIVTTTKTKRPRLLKQKQTGQIRNLRRSMQKRFGRNRKPPSMGMSATDTTSAKSEDTGGGQNRFCRSPHLLSLG